MSAAEFLPFKLKHADESAILYATGPSLNNFDVSLLPEVPDVSVGVNSIIYHDDIGLDYYFCAHDVSKEYKNHPHRELNDEFPLLEKIKSRCNSMQVFCAITFNGDVFPDFFTVQEAGEMGAITYDLSGNSGAQHFQRDLTVGPMYNHSIVFPALQFLLYTGVGRIYLVGCDCGGGASYLNQKAKWVDRSGRPTDVVWNWHEFLEFKDTAYPSVEVISVNPQGLVGLFTDYITTE